MTDALTAEILERVPLKLRNEYAAAWESYRSTCARRDATPGERAEAYGAARKLDDKHHAAVEKAAAAIKCDEQRRATSTL